jgi:hypothetical protein
LQAEPGACPIGIRDDEIAEVGERVETRHVAHGLTGGAAAVQHDDERIRLAPREASRSMRRDVQQIGARLAPDAQLDLRRAGFGGRRTSKRAAPGGAAREREQG